MRSFLWLTGLLSAFACSDSTAPELARGAKPAPPAPAAVKATGTMSADSVRYVVAWPAPSGKINGYRLVVTRRVARDTAADLMTSQLSATVSVARPATADSVRFEVYSMRLGVQSATAATATLPLAAAEAPADSTPLNHPPVAAFTWSCSLARTCQFDATSSTDDHRVTGAEWTFGDGTNGTGLTTAHSYGGSTTSFAVRLVVADSAGRKDTATQTVVVPQALPPTEHQGYFVAPSGRSTNAGTRSSPWDLPSVLSGSHGVRDTVWVLGGTYQATSYTTFYIYNSNLTVRAYPGQRATVSGIIAVLGSNVTLWGLEVVNPTPMASTYVGINVRGTGTRLINLVVHDAQRSGIDVAIEATGTLVYGSLLYNNGTIGNQDHGVYATRTTTVEDNAIFNNEAYGVHGYSSLAGGIDQITVRGNSGFDNGLINPTVGGRADILIGGVATTGDVVDQNSTYRSDGLLTVDLGFNSGNGTLGFTNNYLVGKLNLSGWSSVTQFGNTVIGPVPSGQRVTVRPNRYEPGRAMITVYNWSNAASAVVDLSQTGLKPGQAFEIRNVQQFYGTPMLTGTYSGGSVVLPIVSVAPPTPIGRSSAAPGTGTRFGVYLVLPVEAP